MPFSVAEFTAQFAPAPAPDIAAPIPVLDSPALDAHPWEHHLGIRAFLVCLSDPLTWKVTGWDQCLGRVRTEADKPAYNQGIRTGPPDWAKNGRRVKLTRNNWVDAEMIVPAPKFHKGSEYDRKRRISAGANPPPPPLKIQKSSVFVTDFDEAKGRCLGRKLPDLLAMVRASGADPLCIVPSKTKGNYQFWFALDSPHWQKDSLPRKYLMAPVSWQCDPDYHYRTLAYSPVATTYRPLTGAVWWNPSITATFIPTVPLSVFEPPTPAPPATTPDPATPPEPRTPPASTPPASTPRTGQRIATADLFETRHTTAVGGRMRTLEAVLRRGAADCRSRQPDRPPTYLELLAIGLIWNNDLPSPLPLDQVSSKVHAEWAAPFSDLQANRKSTLTRSQVYPVLDQFVCLQLAKGLPPSLDSAGFIHRHGSPSHHPDFSRFAASPGKPSKRQLAELVGQPYESVKNWIKRYGATYEELWAITPADPQWAKRISTRKPAPTSTVGL